MCSNREYGSSRLEPRLQRLLHWFQAPQEVFRAPAARLAVGGGHRDACNTIVKKFLLTLHDLHPTKTLN